MARLVTPQIRTACGMGKCPKVFRTVAAAMRHVGKHRLNAPAPDGREKSIWRVRYRMARSGWLEIVEVLSGPLPNLPIHAREFSQDGQGAAKSARGTV